MDAIRRGWDKEITTHEIMLEMWRLEEREHTMTLEQWRLEKAWHDRDVAHRIKQENERQERVKKEWTEESERHGREAEEYEKLVARRIREEQDRQRRVWEKWDLEEQEHKKEVAQREQEEQVRQEKVRVEWDLEELEHKKEVVRKEREEEEHREDERRKWKHEIEDHDRIVEERDKREEEERLKLNMFWGGIEAHKCVTYGAREYTAQLMNLPTTWEHPVEACKATPLEIHGISYLPRSCEDRGFGVVIGRWEINQHEPDCASFWTTHKDKGCTSPGSGKRRIEHYLENLPQDGDWREFCATTPVRFQGFEFTGAQECFQSKWGVYGLWEISDLSCS